LLRLHGFADIEVGTPVIRRGKSGHFYNKGLEGVAHHAVIPNVNVLDDLEPRLGRLSDDEKRLFALLCRSYLAAVMPDYEYRQTVATINVPVPGGATAEFRATGHIPLRLGWKAVYGALLEGKDRDNEPEQTLPRLTNGEAATLTKPKVEAKRTQPPPRYSEGTLVEAMQNSWRFVKDPGLRDRLKEAKGIGTPATRADIIKGLKRQNLLAADGKFVVPTTAGLQIFELLRGAAPSLVDPGTTAQWEMQLDDIVCGRADFRAVIDGISGMAEQLIEVLRGHPGSTVDLAVATATTGRGRRQTRAVCRPNKGLSAARTARQRRSDKPAAPTLPMTDEDPEVPPSRPTNARGSPPTAKMVAYAKRLAGSKKIRLPAGCTQDFETCRRFLDQHAR
jgi:DNA topoisomerase-3